MMSCRRFLLLLACAALYPAGARAEPEHDASPPHGHGGSPPAATAADSHAPDHPAPPSADVAPTPKFAAALASFLEEKAAEPADAVATTPPPAAHSAAPASPAPTGREAVPAHHEAPALAQHRESGPHGPAAALPGESAPDSGDVTAAPASATPASAAVHDAHDIAVAPENPAELTGLPVDSLMRLGESQMQAGDNVGAITAFYQVLQAHVPPETEVAALVGLSSAYKAAGERTRAVAILERLIKDHPGAPETARALLDAGRLHRSLGADRLALSRFYAVLQATLRIPDPTWAELYRQLARTAQYEIAETHLRAGRYDEAERYFTRFSLLELAPADRARGAFKVIEARAAAGHNEAVIAGVNEFIDQYPKDEHVPAALHHAATALRELGRADDALGYTLRLLQGTQEQLAANPAAWAYWQRRTGNELANTFFQRGEFANARQIYDTLAALDPAPEWNLPASYQSALCRERLGMTPEALTIYRDIVARTATDAPQSLREIGQMAAWRITHLETIDRERSDIRQLISSLPPESATASQP